MSTPTHIAALTTPPSHPEWQGHLAYPEGSVGRMLEPTEAVLPLGLTVAQAVEQLRDVVHREFVTYGFVLDGERKLVGIVAMRELLFSEPDEQLADVMVRSPFSLQPEIPLMEAMKLVVTKHFPVYPVCDAQGRLLGLVRGSRLFEQQAIEISAQPGRMVGVEGHERLDTPWTRSLRSRHPWLQLNLLTAFAAGAVVNLFQGTIDRLVVLAVFLPVLAGQSGNTGCQALAVTLRGMTLGDLEDGSVVRLVSKEAVLGLVNGLLVGLSAGVGMYLLALSQDNPLAMKLTLVVVAAMTVSCLVSGICGALVPLTLRKLGADPATASSIFVTTATDVASMGLFLGLATLFI